MFECTTFVHNFDSRADKLSPCAIKIVFLGYLKSSKCYKCYCPINRRVFVSKDVTFHESTPYFAKANNKGEQWRKMSAPQLLITSETTIIESKEDESSERFPPDSPAIQHFQQEYHRRGR